MGLTNVLLIILVAVDRYTGVQVWERFFGKTGSGGERQTASVPHTFFVLAGGASGEETRITERP